MAVAQQPARQGTGVCVADAGQTEKLRHDFKVASALAAWRRVVFFSFCVSSFFVTLTLHFYPWPAHNELGS
jgi:hypothetical protein